MKKNLMENKIARRKMQVQEDDDVHKNVLYTINAYMITKL